MIKVFLTSQAEKRLRKIDWRKVFILTSGVAITFLLVYLTCLYTYQL